MGHDDPGGVHLAEKPEECLVLRELLLVQVLPPGIGRVNDEEGRRSSVPADDRQGVAVEDRRLLERLDDAQQQVGQSAPSVEVLAVAVGDELADSGRIVRRERHVSARQEAPRPFHAVGFGRRSSHLLLGVRRESDGPCEFIGVLANDIEEVCDLGVTIIQEHADLWSDQPGPSKTEVDRCGADERLDVGVELDTAEQVGDAEREADLGAG